MSDFVFSKYSKYYDLIYKDKDYQGEAGYIHNLINKYGNSVRSILELGTGTGRHAKLLNELGYDLTGIERSEDMATIARSVGVNCIVAGTDNFNLNSTFDCSIALFHVISYITQNESLIKTFNNVYKHLKTDGVFIFDAWYSPAVYTIRPQTRIKRVENESIMITRLAEPVINFNKNIVTVNYEIIVEDKKTKNIERIYESHPMRHYSIPELELLTRMTGFEILHHEEWKTGNNPSKKTWGVCFILRKIKYEANPR